jgi:hypothetical protein
MKKLIIFSSFFFVVAFDAVHPGHNCLRFFIFTGLSLKAFGLCYDDAFKDMTSVYLAFCSGIGAYCAQYLIFQKKGYLSSNDSNKVFALSWMLACNMQYCILQY